MKAEYPKVPFDTFAEIGYASVNVVANAAKGLERRHGVVADGALPKVTNYDTGFGPVAGLLDGTGLRRIRGCSTSRTYVYVAKNGVYGLASPAPIDTTPALQVVGREVGGRSSRGDGPVGAVIPGG